MQTHPFQHILQAQSSVWLVFITVCMYSHVTVCSSTRGLIFRLAVRRFKAKKKAFHRYAKKYTDGKKTIEEELNQLKKNCSVIRVLAHTQITKIGYGQKKAHMSEIQVRNFPFLSWSHGLLGPVSHDLFCYKSSVPEFTFCSCD